jgi:hypothetical protein
MSTLSNHPTVHTTSISLTKSTKLIMTGIDSITFLNPVTSHPALDHLCYFSVSLFSISMQEHTSLLQRLLLLIQDWSIQLLFKAISSQLKWSQEKRYLLNSRLKSRTRALAWVWIELVISNYQLSTHFGMTLIL